MTKILNIKTLLGIGATVLLTSCSTTKCNIETKLNGLAKEQIEQDSLLYRTIFNQTQAAKDSAIVAEFNEIVADMKNLQGKKRFELGREILQKAQKNGINEYETKIIKGVQYISNKEAIKSKQQLADKYVFEKFFKKHGILK